MVLLQRFVWRPAPCWCQQKSPRRSYPSTAFQASKNLVWMAESCWILCGEATDGDSWAAGRDMRLSRAQWPGDGFLFYHYFFTFLKQILLGSFQPKTQGSHITGIKKAFVYSKIIIKKAKKNDSLEHSTKKEIKKGNFCRTWGNTEMNISFI